MRDATDDPVFQIGDKVKKTTGYSWPGQVVSVFRTLAGKPRIVVECNVPEVKGALHIYAPAQLEFDETAEGAVLNGGPDPEQLHYEADNLEAEAKEAPFGTNVRETKMQAAGTLRSLARGEVKVIPTDS